MYLVRAANNTRAITKYFNQLLNNLTPSKFIFRRRGRTEQMKHWRFQFMSSGVRRQFLRLQDTIYGSPHYSL